MKARSEEIVKELIENFPLYMYKEEKLQKHLYIIFCILFVENKNQLEHSSFQFEMINSKPQLYSLHTNHKWSEPIVVGNNIKNSNLVEMYSNYELSSEEIRNKVQKLGSFLSSKDEFDEIFDYNDFVSLLYLDENEEKFKEKLEQDYKTIRKQIDFKY